MPKTLADIETVLRSVGRDLCDLAMTQPYSNELAMATMSLQSTLSFILQEQNKLKQNDRVFPGVFTVPLPINAGTGVLPPEPCSATCVCGQGPFDP